MEPKIVIVCFSETSWVVILIMHSKLIWKIAIIRGRNDILLTYYGNLSFLKFVVFVAWLDFHGFVLFTISGKIKFKIRNLS